MVEVGERWVEILQRFACKVKGIRLIFNWSVKLVSYQITFFYSV